MKNIFLIVVLVSLSFSAALSRADNAAGMTEKGKPMPMAKMQENMLRMHEQMHKIMAAKNPQEREQLMQEHAKMMQETMPMMQGMMSGHGTMGGDAKGGKMDSGMKGM